MERNSNGTFQKGNTEGFKPNNKLAVGLGRPPKDGYSNEELIDLGEEMLQWMRDCDADKKCDVVHLSEFYSELKGIDPDYWKHSITIRPCFSHYHKLSMVWMGKRTLKNKKLSTVYGNRFIGIYFRELDDNEFDKEKRRIDYIHDKNTELAQQYDTNVLSKLDAFMSQLDGLQSLSDLKIEDNKINAEQKS